MYFLHAIHIDRQTRLLNVLGQIAMILGDKKISTVIFVLHVIEGENISIRNTTFFRIVMVRISVN